MGRGLILLQMQESYYTAESAPCTCSQTGGWAGKRRVLRKVNDFRKEGQPATLIFMDQNFTSTLGGDSCMGIFRMENCSLIDSTDMIIEVLEGSTLKARTILLVGSISSLLAVATAYTQETGLPIPCASSRSGGVCRCARPSQSCMSFLPNW